MSTPVTETAAPAAAPAPARPAPLASRIVDTFLAPSQAFEQLRGDDAPWVGAVLVSTLVIGAMFVLRAFVFTPHELAQAAVQQMGAAAANLTQEQMDRIESTIRVRTMIGAGIGIPVAFIQAGLLGLLLAGVQGLLLGGRTSVRPYVAVAAHAMLVGALGVVVVSAVQFATHRTDLAFDASLLAPGLEPGSILERVLKGITPFGIWMTVLLALGGAVVNGKKGWGAAFAILYGIWMALVVVFALALHALQGRAAAG